MCDWKAEDFGLPIPSLALQLLGVLHSRPLRFTSGEPLVVNLNVIFRLGCPQKNVDDNRNAEHESNDEADRLEEIVFDINHDLDLSEGEAELLRL